MPYQTTPQFLFHKLNEESSAIQVSEQSLPSWKCKKKELILLPNAVDGKKELG